MRPRKALARRRAAELLRKAHVASPPVQVEDIAELMGAVVRYQPFEGQMSGMLHRAQESAVIGINSMHPRVRQRFSIAHELGHLALHKPEFQIDQHAFIAFRGPESGATTDPMEIEANQFAAALLMPEDLLAECITELGEDPDVQTAVTMLARRFDVSEQAMLFRLTNLKWII